MKFSTIKSVLRTLENPNEYLYSHYVTFLLALLERKTGDTYIRCDACGKFELKEDSTTYDEGTACQSCAEDLYTCDHCGKVSFDGNTDVEDEYWCDHCVENSATRCADCESYVRDGQISTVNGEPICPSCLEDHHHWCEACDEYVYYTHECENCTSKFVKSYSTKAENELGYNPRPTYVKIKGKLVPRYIGMEFEVQCLKDDMHYDPAYDVVEVIDNIILCEDGSLDKDDWTGFELKTWPTTFAECYKVGQTYQEVLKASRARIRAHDGGDCGIHLHLSRNALPKSLQIKMWLFFNSEDNKDLIASAFRRYDVNYCRINPDDDNLPDVIRKVVKESDVNYSRYSILNFTDKTVEVRGIRATLKLETFLASVELVEAFLEFAPHFRSEQMTQGYFLEWLRKPAVKGFAQLKQKTRHLSVPKVQNSLTQPAYITKAVKKYAVANRLTVQLAALGPHEYPKFLLRTLDVITSSDLRHLPENTLVVPEYVKWKLVDPTNPLLKTVEDTSLSLKKFHNAVKELQRQFGNMGIDNLYNKLLITKAADAGDELCTLVKDISPPLYQVPEYAEDVLTGSVKTSLPTNLANLLEVYKSKLMIPAEILTKVYPGIHEGVELLQLHYQGNLNLTKLAKYRLEENPEHVVLDDLYDVYHNLDYYRLDNLIRCNKFFEGRDKVRNVLAQHYVGNSLVNYILNARKLRETFLKFEGEYTALILGISASLCLSSDLDLDFSQGLSPIAALELKMRQLHGNVYNAYNACVNANPGFAVSSVITEDNSDLYYLAA